MKSIFKAFCNFKTRDSLLESPHSSMTMFMFKHVYIYKQYCKRDLLYLDEMSHLWDERGRRWAESDKTGLEARHTDGHWFCYLGANFESWLKHYSASVLITIPWIWQLQAVRRRKEMRKGALVPFITLVTSLINFKSVFGTKWFILLRKVIPGENVKECRNTDRCSAF